MNKTIEDEELKAVANVMYNMGVKGLGEEYALATLKESVEIWFTEDHSSLSAEIEKEKVENPVYPYGNGFNAGLELAQKIVEGKE